MNPANDWVAFDVETVGDKPCYALQPWRCAQYAASIRTYALASIHNGKINSKSTDDIDRVKLSRLLQTLAESGKYIVGWKVAYDMSMLIALGLREEVFACKWIDALVLWKNLDRTRNTYGLKEAVSLFLPQFAGYEEEVDFEGPIEPLLKYNKQDTEFTLILALKFWQQLTERERRALMIDMEDLPVIAERNYKGLEVDLVAVSKVQKVLLAQRNENMEKLRPHLPAPTVLKNGKVVEFNLDSKQQIGKLLFEDWGLPVYSLTPSGAPCVDKEALIETSHVDERAKWIQQYTETTGLLSKCVKAVALSVQYNANNGYIGVPTVYPQQTKSGTVTDRCTYSSKMEDKAKRKKK